MDKECFNGEMEISILESIRTTRRADTDSSLGDPISEKNTKGNGKTIGIIDVSIPLLQR